MTNSLCNIAYAVAFINKHRQEATMISDQLHVPVENILGLAALESQYGQGRIAMHYNNYFSLWAPAPFQGGSISALRNSKAKVATFSSFYDSARSFAASKFGLAVKGKMDPKQFAEKLVSSGYHSGNSADGGTNGYAQNLTNIIMMVKSRMECPTQ